MNEDPFHDWDAAYVLGMLSPDDRRAFEQHLATCAACSAAVAELAGMPGILGTLTTAEAVALLEDEHDQDAVPEPELVARLAVAAGRRRRRMRLATAGAGVAAAAVLLAGGFALGSANNPSTSSSVTAAKLTAMTEVQPGIMTADLAVEKKAWGTRFDWTCHYLNTSWKGGPRSYDLVAITADGTETTVATWTSEGPTAASLAASSSVPTSTILRVEIRLSGSSKPLTVTEL